MEVYLLLNTETNEILPMNVQMILEEINKDRSDQWQPYDEKDWTEGLKAWTQLKVIKKIDGC